MTAVGHVAAEHLDFALLDALGAGDDPQQRRLADAVGADQTDEAVARDLEREVVESQCASVSVREAFEAGDRAAGSRHVHGFPCSRSGHANFGSNFT